MTTQTNGSDLTLVLHATAFAAHKHRDQRRKDHAASPYINHPISLAYVLAKEAGIDDGVVLSAALLHDTIEDTDITASPPADWSLERQREYFDWSKQVVDQVRGVSAKLETLFDIEFAKKP